MAGGKVDLFKEGKGESRVIRLGVRGKCIGSVKFGDAVKPGDPNKIIISINPKFYRSGYKFGDIKITTSEALIIEVIKR